MKINKEFIKILAEKKHGWVGHIIKDMCILKFEGNNIQNVAEHYKTLEQIYYTVYFLEKEELINIDTQNYGLGIPDFNPTNFSIVSTGDSKYMADRIHFIADLNKSYWGKDISITPSFYDFVDKNFKTDKQITDSRNLWLPILVAVITALLTAIFSNFDKVICLFN